MSADRTFRLRIVLEAAVLIVAINAGLRVASFRAVRRALRRVPIRRAKPAAAPEQLLGPVRRAARLVPGENACLITALCGQAILRRYGHDATLRIGVLRATDAPAPGAIRAHAWLEAPDGEPIAEFADLSRYETLPPLDRP